MGLVQWLLLGTGVVCIYVGIGLIVYGILQRRAVAGEGALSDLAKLLAAITALVKALGKFLGANASVNTGAFLILVGIVLVFVPYFFPAATP